MFALPLYRILKSECDVLHFGKKSMPKLADLMKRHLHVNEEVAITLDWSGYDLSVPGWLIRHGFHILKQMLDFSRL
jgi:hypothetical protein